MMPLWHELLLERTLSSKRDDSEKGSRLLHEALAAF
jgi:hypothetical protein